MNKLTSNRNLTIINFVIVTYFVLIFLADFYAVDFTIIGVFKEMLTIPFLIAEMVFIVIGIKYLQQPEKALLTVLSIGLLTICTLITVGSFF